ncbi:class I SAM-dependent methyltransferase [Streptomyces sp. NPDC050315]|uniref:class I SAM-dependent methyltransferase n=1 Tax=Streptomyces sp. NPDC050315 TaxID=3155039 RepID=UPI00343C9A97
MAPLPSRPRAVRPLIRPHGGRKSGRLPVRTSILGDWRGAGQRSRSHLKERRRWPGTEAVAFDGSPQRLAVGLGGASIARCCGDLCQLPIKTATFDVVYCRLALQYIA